MGRSDINETIIDSLYTEALLLADEARFVFDLRNEPPNGIDDLARVALSIEGLRTTTRVMHVLAWLLNQRAFMSGEMSQTALHRHGALPPARASDPNQIMRLEPETRALIRDTERLHARVARLDSDMRAAHEAHGPVMAMHGRIAAAFVGGQRRQAAPSARA